LDLIQPGQQAATWQLSGQIIASKYFHLNPQAMKACTVDQLP